MRLGATLLVAALAASCSSGSSPKAGGPVAPTAPRRVVATVEGTFDGRSLTLRPAASAVGAGLVAIPVVQDGTPRSNPPDTLEMVTESIAFPVAGGCGPGVFSLDAATTVRSFFPHAVLSNVHVEITWMSLTGREACNSESLAPDGTSNQFGLFAYGMLDRLGTGFNAATALWRLRLPDQSPFTFRGRVVADVQSDTTPPTTVNVPPPGRYTDWFPFQAECLDDLSGWGCAGIYYTLDGSTPTTASTWYAGPFTITADTTVKVFSVDMFGNEEPYQTLEYVIDTEPPTVASTSPAAWSVGADPWAPVSVTFSEPVDPASVRIALNGNDSHYFAPDATGQTYTTYDEFEPGTILEITVLAATDLVGRAMAEPFTSTAAIGAVPSLAATSGSSRIVNHDLLANLSYDVVAVWSDWSGAGGRLYAAHRFAAQGWSAPMLLDEGIDPENPFQARLSEGNQGFLVAWSGPNGTRAAFINRISGEIDWTQTLWPDAADADSIGVARGSASAGCCTVARAAGNRIEIIQRDLDGTWQAPELLDTRSLAKWPRIATAYGDSKGYVFFAAEDGYRFVTNDGFYWLPSALVPGAEMSLPPPQLPPVAFEMNWGVELVWASSEGGVFASENMGAGFGAPVELSWPSEPPATHLAGAGYGDYRAVTWGGTGDGYLKGAIHVPGAWNPPEAISTGYISDAMDPDMATNYAVAAVNDMGDLEVVPTYYAVDAPTWGVGTYLYRPEGLSSPARDPQIENAGPRVITWAQEDGTGADGLWWVDDYSPARKIAQASLHREALDVSSAASFASREAGWLELSRSGSQAWRAEWSGDAEPWPMPAVEPFTARGNVTTVATRPFAWTFFAGPTSMYPPYWHVGTYPRVGPSFGDNILGPVELASAGSAEEAVVAYTDGCEVRAAQIEFNYFGSWSPISVHAPPSCDGAYELDAAAGGAGTLVAWRTWWGQIEVRPTSGPLLEWTFGSGADSPRVAVAAPDLGWGLGTPAAAIAYHQDGAIYAGVLPEGGEWGAPVQISPSASSCSAPQLASDGSSFLAVFDCGTELQAARFDGTAWSAPFLVTTNPLASSLAGAPSGYRVGAVLDDAGVAHAYQIRITGTSASTPERIDSEPGAVRPRIRLNADAGFFCAGWSQVVDEPLSAQARARCFL